MWRRYLSVADMVGPGQRLQVGKVDLLAGQVQQASSAVKQGVVAGLAGLRQGQQVAQEAFPRAAAA